MSNGGGATYIDNDTPGLAYPGTKQVRAIAMGQRFGTASPALNNRPGAATRSSWDSASDGRRLLHAGLRRVTPVEGATRGGVAVKAILPSPAQAVSCTHPAPGRLRQGVPVQCRGNPGGL